MKIKIDKKRDRILEAAEKEFLRHGFRDASLRTIAKKARGTTGIIYTYFKNKDEIFRSLVAPLICDLENKLSEDEVTLQEAREGLSMSYQDWFTKNLQYLITLINSYPNEMKLLFLKADGSSLQDCKESLMERGIKRSLSVFRNIERNEEFAGKELSEFFVQNLIAFVINVVVEMLKQNKTKKEIAFYEDEIKAFLFNGWKG